MLAHSPVGASLTVRTARAILTDLRWGDSCTVAPGWQYNCHPNNVSHHDRSGRQCRAENLTAVEPKAIAARDMARIESLAAQYVELVKQTRQQMK